LRRVNYSASGILAAAAILAAVALPAAGQKRDTPGSSTFRTDSSLVLVPITVMDRRGAIVNGLPSDVFTLTEDGVRQQIRSFSEEDLPVSLGIVLDLSGSMRSVLGDAKGSLQALMQGANPEDEAFLKTVSTRPRSYTGFTQDFGAILSQVAFEGAGGSTALVDTIYSSLEELRSGARPRKALLVISDGMDNHSRYSKAELLERAVESDAQIYTIAVSDPASQYAKPITRMEEKQGLLFLDELASRTGGLSFVVRGQADIRAAAANIGQALRNEYTIGYAPAGSSTGKWRKIKVTVERSGMKAYARAGYRLDD